MAKRKGGNTPEIIPRRSSTELIFRNTSLAKSLAKGYEIKLKQAGLSIDPLSYASTMLFYLIIGSVSGVAIAAVGIALIFKFYILAIVKNPKIIIIALPLILFGMLMPIILYLALNANISEKIDKLKVGLDSETPIFSAVFLVYIRSGLNPGYLFEQLAESKAFNNIRKFSSYITKRVKYVGGGIEEALLSAGTISPSKTFRDLLFTYVTAIRTGAPVVNTLAAKAQDILKDFEVLTEKAADNLSGLAEGYVIYLSSGYIFFFLAAIMSGLFPTFKIPLPVLAILAIFVIPMANFVFTFWADKIQVKFPEETMKAYKIFFISFPVGIAVTIVLLALTKQLLPLITLTGGLNNINLTSIDIAVGLIIASIPPYIETKKELGSRSGYNEYIVRFLRAIGEGLRAGLSPQSVMERLRDASEMGKFRTILSEVTAILMFGVSLKDAFKIGASKIRDFTAKVAMVSLADMLEIGSMTPDTIESIAEQIDTQLSSEKRYREKIKILIISPYLAIFLSLFASVVLGASIVKLFSVTTLPAFSYGNLEQAIIELPRITYVIGISSIINAFFAGFFVGKLQTGKTASGFLHCIILTVISTVMVIIAPHLTLVFPHTSTPTI
ncbi:flagellar assembly protein [Sulfolobales archaeon HS-7]|nr:flagellar assembly protein [Sulfolobales archaeon HS-7]